VFRTELQSTFSSSFFSSSCKYFYGGRDEIQKLGQAKMDH
jgi:hypothetical protein